MTLKDSEMNQEDHELKARVGAGLGLTLETGPELNPGLTPKADLGAR